MGNPTKAELAAELEKTNALLKQMQEAQAAEAPAETVVVLTDEQRAIESGADVYFNIHVPELGIKIYVPRQQLRYQNNTLGVKRLNDLKETFLNPTEGEEPLFSGMELEASCEIVVGREHTDEDVTIAGRTLRNSTTERASNGSARRGFTRTQL